MTNLLQEWLDAASGRHRNHDHLRWQQCSHLSWSWLKAQNPFWPRHKVHISLYIREGLNKCEKSVLLPFPYAVCTLTKFFFIIPTVLSSSMPMVNSRKSTIAKNLLQFRVALALQELSQLSPSRWTGAPMPSSSQRKTRPISRWSRQYLVLEQTGECSISLLLYFPPNKGGSSFHEDGWSLWEPLLHR